MSEGSGAERGGLSGAVISSLADGGMGGKGSGTKGIGTGGGRALAAGTTGKEVTGFPELKGSPEVEVSPPYPVLVASPPVESGATPSALDAMA